MKILLYIALLFPVFVHAQSISIFTPAPAICHSSPVLFTAFPAGITDPHYHWEVNGTNSGTDSSRFVYSPINGDSIICLLTNSTGDTVFATSNSIIMAVQTMPHADSVTGSDTACITGTITTLSDATSGGVWSASNSRAAVSSGGVVTGITVYPIYYGLPLPVDTIYYIVTNTCGADTASIIITVNTKPDEVFGIPYQLCLGQTVEITDDYEEPPNEIFATNGNLDIGFGTIGGAHIGADTIICIASNFCGSDTTRGRVSIIPDPVPPVASPIYAQSTTVCVGASIALYDATPGDPIWSASNSNVSLAYGGVTGISPGLDTISLTVEYYNNTCNNYGPIFIPIPSPIVITVIPSSPIINPGIDCTGQPVILFDNVPGGAWSDNNPVVATVQPGTIEPGTAVVTIRSPGIDTIFYTLPDGCTVNTPVIVNPLLAPISGDDILCLGAKTNVSDTGDGTWSVSDTNVIFIDPYLHTVLGTGIGEATISYTISNGCAVTKQVSVFDCTGVLTIFPNPVRNQLIIEADTTLYHSYTIVNCLGQIITHGLLTQALMEIDIPLWPAGVYLMHLEGVINYTSRFVKE